jgi:hypothetical protein
MATETLDERDARAARITLGLLIAVGFVLRIAHTREYGFNFDEAQFVHFGAASSLASVWQFVVNVSPHPPANFLMVHLLQKVSWDPLWLRLPSVLSGTLLIWLSHRFARDLFGPAAGLAMATLVTFSPVLLDLTRVCRNYAPGFVFLLLSFHLMVRHLQTNRWQPLAGFAVAAPLAGIWHYVFIVPFVALDIVVFIELLARRRAWRAWLAVFMAHLPFVAVMGFFYLVHISQMSEHLVGFHQAIYEPMLSPFSAGLIQPLREVWRYLEVAALSDVLLVISSLGALCLLINGERLGLLVCVVPIGVAYAFRWLGEIPFGGSRHSAYIFPFFFGLVASLAPVLLGDYRRTWANLRRQLARVLPVESPSPSNDAARRETRRARLVVPAFGAAVAVIFGGTYASVSLRDFDAVRTFDLLDPDIRKRELPTWYRVEDLERAFGLLEERVGPDDLVVLQSQETYAMRMHYRVGPTDGSWSRFVNPAKSDLKLTRNSVTYYSTRVGLHMTPAGLLESVRTVQSVYGLPEPRRVWTVQGPWAQPLGLQFRYRHPDLAFDKDVERRSNGLAFAIDMEVLRMLDPEAGAGGEREAGDDEVEQADVRRASEP